MKPNDHAPAGGRAADGETHAIARDAGIVGGATLLSRVLGLVREQVMASWFGAGLASDAFNVAFRIPNLLRDLFAEGAMSAAFVPTFTATLQREGRAAAWALGRQLLVTLGLVLAIVCVAGGLFAPWLVKVFAPGFGAIDGKLELTVLLTRVMLPFLPLVALAAVAMGMLNALGRFAVPALAPALLNLGMILGGLALMPVCGAVGQPAILAMAAGVVIGGLGQFLVQLPSLRAEGFEFRLEWPRAHPGVQRVARLMAPATIGLAATQFNLFVSTLIASLLPQGSVSWLWYAFRLMQLPIGVFGVALATVSLPAFSRAAAAGDHRSMARTLSSTVRLLMVLTVPAAVWLAAMSRPVIALLYEHGRFGGADTTATSGALVLYCIGLPAFAAVGVFTRAFYALGETAAPVRASFIAVALNLALNLAFIGPLRRLGLDHMGLALAASLTSILNLAQLAFLLRRRLGPIEGGRLVLTLLKVLAASLLAGAFLVWALWALADRAYGHWTTELGVVAGGLVIGGAIVWGALRALRVEELGSLTGMVVPFARRFLR
ncbi:MAG: murein biosynthesis integral membrane protein MurJ [Candidatus Eisenbacteria bacterium]|uniref:Probable lipid II flippase MurJ n=1 Tax=Eiseniibacteriota bacterium TaxID=2212470 RepID=A0A849SGQ2_UNCEI|nr:murein biosynthesis integral membrane protein MurJ [Candidatus Eisenbacteria bacterium]